MQRIGLALSGGGFRATIYHLGVVRFMRDAGLLDRVTHLTMVSGGSILGAHLALNWDRYCGSGTEFDQAAREVLHFVQLDVRNRIVRRFPMASSLNFFRRWSRMGLSRRLTRPGLLEMYYEKYLYGDVGLSQLPRCPEVHILATNLSEGCLCSFNAEGLLLQRRAPGRRDRFERLNIGLATVSMAVAASSAFPGFFPPLELRGWDVGAEEGELNRQAFTDGGVFDNLGLRMFSCIEQSWAGESDAFQKEDFLALDEMIAALNAAESMPQDSPLRRLRVLLDSLERKYGRGSSSTRTAEATVRGISEIVRNERLYRDPGFQGLELADPHAELLLHNLRNSNAVPDRGDRVWLNRQIVEATLRQVVGKPCLRISRSGFDAIIVSDAGGKFKIASDGGAGGLIRTALRSSDILMDRVWQMELENFQSSPNVVFCPITDVISPNQDRTALHPEVQRQASRVRTDLDRFSNLEISALIRQGYCVARQNCRNAKFLKLEASSDAPWDPFVDTESEERPKGIFEPARFLDTSRKLRNSARRRTWSTLLSLRDWPTYLWVPLMIVLSLSLPYTIYRLAVKSRRQHTVLTAIAETSPVYRRILDLMDTGPTTEIIPLPVQDVDELPEPNMEGFEFVSDTRIVDLRGWKNETTATLPPYMYQHLRVRRKEIDGEYRSLRIQANTQSDMLELACRTQSVRPELSRSALSDGSYQWQLEMDLSRLPQDGVASIVMESLAGPEFARQSADEGSFSFKISVPTGLLEIWILMPTGRSHEVFEMISHPVGKFDKAQIIEPDTRVDLPLGAIATFRFVNPEPDRRYHCRWKWSKASN